MQDRILPLSHVATLTPFIPVTALTTLSLGPDLLARPWKGGDRETTSSLRKYPEHQHGARRKVTDILPGLAPVSFSGDLKENSKACVFGAWASVALMPALRPFGGRVKGRQGTRTPAVHRDPCQGRCFVLPFVLFQRDTSLVKLNKGMGRRGVGPRPCTPVLVEENPCPHPHETPHCLSEVVPRLYVCPRSGSSLAT